MYFVGFQTPALTPKGPRGYGVVGITVPYFARVGFRV